MSGYWTESFAVADALERERQEADLRDWENEQRRDREIDVEWRCPGCNGMRSALCSDCEAAFRERKP